MDRRHHVLLAGDQDPLGVDGFATHRTPLDQDARAYADFQAKADGTVKVLLQPRAAATCPRLV